MNSLAHIFTDCNEDMRLIYQWYLTHYWDVFAFHVRGGGKCPEMDTSNGLFAAKHHDIKHVSTRRKLKGFHSISHEIHAPHEESFLGATRSPFMGVVLEWTYLQADGVHKSPTFVGILSKDEI